MAAMAGMAGDDTALVDAIARELEGYAIERDDA
jgi:hypothetical protein